MAQLSDTSNEIETFNLFGESRELPDVVHCETIQARSIIHDWEFKAHRHHRLHQILLIETGGGSGKLDADPIKFRSGTLINVPAGCVHAFKFMENSRGWVVTLASELLDEVLQKDEGLRAQLSHATTISQHRSDRDLIKSIFQEHAERNFARAHLLRALSALLLGQVARAIQNLDNPNRAMQDDPLRSKFEHLLETHFDRHWSVGEYARELSVTPTHLSRVLRDTTGLPASKLIEARIMREARRHLYFTNLSISQIAYLLGYEDPAYFSRVFSKASGISPKKFRARAEGAA